MDTSKPILLIPSHPKLPAPLKWFTYGWYVLLLIVLLYSLYTYCIATRPSSTYLFGRVSMSSGGMFSRHEETFSLGLKHALGPTMDFSLYPLLAMSVIYAVLGTRIRRVRVRKLEPWGLLLLLFGSLQTLLFLFALLNGMWFALLPLLLMLTCMVVPAIGLLVYSTEYHELWQLVNLGAIDTPEPPEKEARVPAPIARASILLASYGLVCIVVSMLVLGYWLEVGVSPQLGGNAYLYQARPSAADQFPRDSPLYQDVQLIKLLGRNSIMLTAEVSVTNYFSFLSPFYNIHQAFENRIPWSSAIFIWPQLICITWGLILIWLACQLYSQRLDSLKGIKAFLWGSVIGLTVFCGVTFFTLMSFFLTMPNMLFPGSLILLLVRWMLKGQDEPYAVLRKQYLEQEARYWQKEEQGREDEDATANNTSEPESQTIALPQTGQIGVQHQN